jgi:alpha-1,6-mannosyltransferase
MYSWIHVFLATACALVAWYTLYRAPQPRVQQAEEVVVA